MYETVLSINWYGKKGSYELIIESSFMTCFMQMPESINDGSSDGNGDDSTEDGMLK